MPLDFLVRLRRTDLGIPINTSRGGEVAKQEVAVEWVLIMSLQWVVAGSATAPTTHTMEQFQTENSCKAAAQEIKNEMKATIQGAETHARVVCVRRK